MAYNEDSSASGHDEPWIQWFCGLKGHEMFCEVERAYIEDGFNLYGLRACVSNFSDCLDLILDRIGPDDSDDSHLTQSACTLYGLIHARYIVTAHGLDSMYNKYAAKEFGSCPLVQCNGHPVLPLGLRDEIGIDTVKIFCPKCQCAYQLPPLRSSRGGAGGGGGQHHPSSVGGGGGAVDGAAIGTTFPHLFLLTFNNLVPDPLPVDSAYIPRVFGFRVHKSNSKMMQQTGNATNASLAVGAGSNVRPATNGSTRGVGGSFTSQKVDVAKSNNNAEGEGDTAAVNDGKDCNTGAEIVEIKTQTKMADGANSGGNNKQGDDKSKSSDAASKSSSPKKANGDGITKEEKTGGNETGEGNAPKRKSKEGDSAMSNNDIGGSSKSRSSKRQKRQVGTEVT